LRHAACPRHPPRGFADVGDVRRAAANHRYDSPQGRFGSIPTIITASSRRGWRAPPPDVVQHLLEADAPERPDPYLSNLDLVAIGTRPEKSNDAIAKRSNHLRIVK